MYSTLVGTRVKSCSVRLVMYCVTRRPLVDAALCHCSLRCRSLNVVSALVGYTHGVHLLRAGVFRSRIDSYVLSRRDVTADADCVNTKCIEASLCFSSSDVISAIFTPRAAMLARY